MTFERRGLCVCVCARVCVDGWDEMINPSVLLLLRMQLRAREMFSLGNWKPSRLLRVWRKGASGSSSSSSSWMYLFSPFSQPKKEIREHWKKEEEEEVSVCARAASRDGWRTTRWLFRFFFFFFFFSDRMFIQIAPSPARAQGGGRGGGGCM